MSTVQDPGHATQRLSLFAQECQADRLPPSVRHAARRAFVNIVGCCLSGSRSEIVDVATHALLPFGGQASNRLLGRAERTDMLSAAHINCLSSAALSFDDTHAQTVLHPSGAVATALLAIGERMPMTGQQFLAAFIVGVEIASRVSKSVSTSPAAGEIGWSQTGIANGLGVAASAGRALGLDAAGIGASMGIAALQSSGLRVAHGTMAGSLIFANAAQSGLRAVILAQAGFGAPAEPIEGRFGFLELFSKQPCPDYLTQGLGDTYEVESLTYKPYPCGVVIHPALDAALEWHRRHGPAAVDELDTVHLTLHERAIALGAARRHPASPLEAKVSLCHWVAVALCYGRAGIAELQEAAICDPRVARLRDSITMVQADQMGPEAAVMAAVTTSGAEDTVTIEHCKGSFAVPMSDQDLNEKFLGQACMVLTPQQADQLLQACWRVDALPDVGAVVQLAHCAG